MDTFTRAQYMEKDGICLHGSVKPHSNGESAFPSPFSAPRWRVNARSCRVHTRLFGISRLISYY
jgi:hypothetical protein